MASAIAPGPRQKAAKRLRQSSRPVLLLPLLIKRKEPASSLTTCAAAKLAVSKDREHGETESGPSWQPFRSARISSEASDHLSCFAG